MTKILWEETPDERANSYMAEKFRIGLPGTTFPFIPPANKFLEHMGMPGGIADVINSLGASLDQPLPDPKTVRKAVNEGVPSGSFNRIQGMMDSVLSPEMHDYVTGPYLAPWMETKLHHNGLAWLCMTKGYHLRIFQADQPQTFTEQFIERRAEQELELFQAGLEIQKYSAAPEFFEERWRETLTDFLPRHTKVEPVHIANGLQASADLKTSTGQSRSHQAGRLLGLYTRLRVDFYYQLLCNVSLDLIRWFKEKDTIAGREQWLIENSLFGDMVPAVDGNRMMLPFERLLDTWRRKATPDNKDLSWAQIAQCLPNPFGEDEITSLPRGQTKEEREANIRKNKKSRLREWRDGTRPKSDQLKQFVQNLVPEENDVSFAMMKTDIACIWGAFLIDEWATFEKCGLIGALRETLPVFESFPAYWADYQSQAAKIIAA
jgi:hypothetical protein